MISDFLMQKVLDDCNKKIRDDGTKILEILNKTSDMLAVVTLGKLIAFIVEKTRKREERRKIVAFVIEMMQKDIERAINEEDKKDGMDS